MGCDSCTAKELRQLAGIRAWAGQVAVVAGANAGHCQGSSRHGSSSSAGSKGAARALGFLNESLVFHCLFSHGQGTLQMEPKILM